MAMEAISAMAPYIASALAMVATGATALAAALYVPRRVRSDTKKFYSRVLGE